MLIKMDLELLFGLFQTRTISFTKSVNSLSEQTVWICFLWTLGHFLSLLTFFVLAFWFLFFCYFWFILCWSRGMGTQHHHRENRHMWQVQPWQWEQGQFQPQQHWKQCWHSPKQHQGWIFHKTGPWLRSHPKIKFDYWYYLMEYYATH